MATLQAYSILALGSGWPFVLTIVLEVITALLAFVRLLGTLWRRSAA